ncbi:SPOR domain-containing protein [Portibacter lacus]|nr:hypothetical protein [Portibacter lacus]
MSIDRLELGPNIRNYIELNNSLDLVGIGRLVKRNKSTVLNKESNFILPSASALELESSHSTSDGNFINFLSNKMDIALEDAQVIYKKWCAELSFDLETKGKVALGGLGKFIKRGNQSTFEMEDAALAGNTFGLPALKLSRLTPVTPPVVAKIEEDLVVKSLRIKDKSDRNFLLNTAAVAALFMLLVFSYHYYWPSEKVNHLSHLKVDQERLNKDPEKLLVSEKFIPELIPGIVEPEEHVASCALIIGSFSRKSNADEIQEKAITAGYEVFTEEYHEFYRVGISMPCNEIQGAAFREVEEAFGIDPWLLIH